MRQYIRSGLLRVFLLTMGWWAMTEGAASGWSVGVPVIVLATAVSFHMAPPRSERWTLLGMIRYARFFVWGSLRGGVDVAVRAIRPSMPITPGLLQYRLRLPPGAPRVLFRITLSQMPGSLGTHLEAEDDLVVHVLTKDDQLNQKDLQELESQVARLFQVDLSEPPAPSGVSGA